MNWDIYPEEKIAKRVIEKFSLFPPIDVFDLVNSYASVEKLEIPFDVDGITLNLKIPGKSPHVVLNKKRSLQRMRFTLAHELGHLLVPWHMGTIVDITDNDQLLDVAQSTEYRELEAQANRFASELLMPAEWISKLIKENEDPEALTRDVFRTAQVSSLAATIRIAQWLPEGYVYAQLRDGTLVSHSGRTYGTIANQPRRGCHINPASLFPSAERIHEFRIQSDEYVWWKFSKSIDLPNSRVGEAWREILDRIVVDIGARGEAAVKLKSKINGVVAYANGSVRGRGRTREAVYSACLQRFESKPDMKEIIEHPSFKAFLAQWIYDHSND